MLAAALVLTACVSKTVKRVDTAPPRMAEEEIAESQLLDVGIKVFDPNIPEAWADRERAAILPEIRQAEAQFMPYQLKETLQSTASWGAVRVLPRETNAVDVTVEGRLLQSDGETLRIEATVTDATGRQWFSRIYEHQTSRFSYDEDAPEGHEPFQMLYNEIADDLLAYRQEQLAMGEIDRIRQVSRMRFAREFAPQVFEPYVAEDDGRFELQRLPAEDDPMMSRIGRIREREYLFIDTLDEHYARFASEMTEPYTEFRKGTYEEAVALRELRAQARRRTIAGAAAVIGGIYGTVRSDSLAGRAASQVGVIGGAQLLRSGLARREEAQLHATALQELGASLEQELAPSVIELEDRVIRLTGTVEDQYDQWRETLREIHYAELGLLPVEDASEDDAPVDGD